MEMETGFLQYAVELLKKDYAHELSILTVELPKVDKIPAVRFDKAKELVAEKYNRKIRNPYDLEPEEEALIGRYFKEEYDADFVFVTHYPSKKRPFYAMDDPSDEKFTLSFDLLFKGLEVTTGGQRIHDYQMLKDKIAAVVWMKRVWSSIWIPSSMECRLMEDLESDWNVLPCRSSEKKMFVRPVCSRVI